MYLAETLSRLQTAGDGHFTRRCHQLLETQLGAKKVLLTTSCTHALEMAALLLNVGPGDEVIVPSFTFVSTANSFALRGARPVFCDIMRETLNLNPEHLGRLISSRTRAIVPVHYAGVSCEMNEIVLLAQRHNVQVVEDNAHGLFGRYRGQALGTFGCLATQSFHETKNFSCGEGGALLINDESMIDRAEIIREKGTDRSRFFRGQVDKYTWVDLGSSYLMGEILAAHLFAQLEKREIIQAKRRYLWETYDRGISAWAAAGGIQTPVVPADCEQSYHMYYIVLPSVYARQSLTSYLMRNGILAVFHYQPLHLSPMGRRFGGVPGDCPVSEQVADRVLRLPFFTAMTEDDLQEVIAALLRWNGA